MSIYLRGIVVGLVVLVGKYWKKYSGLYAFGGMGYFGAEDVASRLLWVLEVLTSLFVNDLLTFFKLMVDVLLVILRI